MHLATAADDVLVEISPVEKALCGKDLLHVLSVEDCEEGFGLETDEGADVGVGVDCGCGEG